jgi:hypothetical protein
MRVLIFGVVATLALSAGAASAQEAVYPRHGHAPYGYRYSGYAYGYHHRHYGHHHRYARYRYYFEASPLPAQRSNPRLIRRENRWERCQRERMLVRSRTIAAPLLVRHPTLPCAARHACTRHRMGTRQSRRFSSRRRLCCESANDNSPLPTAVVEFDLDQQRAFAIHLHLPR